MTDAEMQAFVDAFAAAWATRNGAAFLNLWHPDGVLRSPFVNRLVKGSELGMLNDLQKKSAPALVWKLISWSGHGNVVFIEWENTNRYGNQVMTWRGVDRITVEEGKIREEIVYADTAPLQARRRGLSLEALFQLPD